MPLNPLLILENLVFRPKSRVTVVEQMLGVSSKTSRNLLLAEDFGGTARPETDALDEQRREAYEKCEVEGDRG